MTSPHVAFIDEALALNPPKGHVVDDSTSYPLVIAYRAPNDTALQKIALVNVSANGDILFFRGSTAASATLDTNISLGATGRVRVSVAAYDTFGEVADAINAGTATHGYRALVRDALRSDSSNDTLKLRARTNAGVQSDGIALLVDSAVAKKMALQIGRKRGFNDPANTGWIPICRRVTGLVDFTTGASQYRIYKRNGTTETEVDRWKGAAAGAEKDRDLAYGQKGAGVWGDKGGELIVVSRGSSTLGAWTDGYLVVEEQVAQVTDIR